MKWDREKADGGLLRLSAFTDAWSVSLQAEDFEAEHFILRLRSLKRMTPALAKEAAEKMLSALEGTP